MRRARAGLTAALLLVLAALTPAASAAPQSAPQVIGGGGNYGPAAVALEFGEFGNQFTCTGSLWRPTIVITSAHCLEADKPGEFFRPRAILVWPPGGSTDRLPAAVEVTDVVVRKDWQDVDDELKAVGRDIAMLVLSRPVGQPYYSRLATPMEVQALTWNQAKADFAGYGITAPKSDPDAPSPALPKSLSSTFLRGYNGGPWAFDVAADGTSGTCLGDSGGPWMAVVAGTRVLVGPLSGTSGAPCGEPMRAYDTYANGAVASANRQAVKKALRLAGEQPDEVPTTCIKGPDLDRNCWDGRAWEYSFCWDVPRAELWWATGADNWNRIARTRGSRDEDLCEDPGIPYAVTFRQIVPAGKTRQAYSVRIPKQAGNPREVRDDFTATVR